MPSTSPQATDQRALASVLAPNSRAAPADTTAGASEQSGEIASRIADAVRTAPVERRSLCR